MQEFRKFVLSALVLVVLCVPAFAGDKLIESLLKSSVTVKAPGGTGSGTVICRGDYCYVLTAGHVVSDARRIEEDSLTGKKKVTWEPVYVYQIVKEDSEDVGQVLLKAEVIRYSDADSGQDLAVLRIKKKHAFPSGIEFRLDKTPPDLGTDLWHVGSPLEDLGAGSVIPATISAHGRVFQGTIYDQLSGNIFPGSSGGMVCQKADGKYVGMVLRGATGGFVFIRPVREISTWAKKVGVDFVLDPKVAVPTDEELKKKPVEDTPQSSEKK